MRTDAVSACVQAGETPALARAPPRPCDAVARVIRHLGRARRDGAIPAASTAAAVRRKQQAPGDGAEREDDARGPAGRRVAPARPPASRFDQGVHEAEEPEREQDRGRCGGPGRPACEPAGDDQDLADEERRGRKAGERAERDAEHASRARAGCAARRGGVCAARGSCAEQRRRGIEAERLRDRVPGDVHRDAGERERGSEADPERDHAHVLEAGVGEQALPGQRAPEERHGDGEREQTEADQHSARRRLADHRRERLAERQATSSTVGSSAAESSAETGGGASECASGSQLCTGAQPIFAARPARRSK